MPTASCFFIGHRDAGAEVFPLLAAEVERHITEYGVKEFCVGHYGNFDRMAARVLTEAKSRHPEISLQLLTPYHPFERPTDVPDGFDGTFYPPGMESVPKQYAIPKANRYMIQTSTHLIAYAHFTASNTRKFVDYAQARERKGLMKVTLINDRKE